MQILVKKAAEAGYCEFAFRILQIARFAASAHFINCSCYTGLRKTSLHSLFITLYACYNIFGNIDCKSRFKAFFSMRQLF